MPVTRTQVVNIGFGASHSVKGHPQCDGDHGHYFTVAAHFRGEPPPGNWGEVLEPETLVKAIGIVRELKGRSINRVLPAVSTTPNGLAAYFLERLSILGCFRVEVHESDTDVTGIADRS